MKDHLISIIMKDHLISISGFTRLGRVPVSRSTTLVLAACAAAATAAVPMPAVSAGQASTAMHQSGLTWFGAQSDAAQRLLDLLSTSQIDGVNPRQFNVRSLERAVRGAAGNPDAMRRADAMLTDAFLHYAKAVRAVAPSSEWTVVDREVAARGAPVAALLRQAAAEGRVDRFLATMPWMHEHYAGLRMSLLEAERRHDRAAAARLRLNLDRVRMLPATGPQRYVLVNAAAQRLYMYEHGKVVDWMRVVVGKPAHATPMMAALIRYTAVNPYWNLASDLVAEKIAPNVVRLGLPYLKEKGYVVLSDWSDSPRRIDPSTVDWKGVVAGRTEIRLRQNPGPANAMGRMKFMFPNKAGVYLHDTPNKELLDEDARLLSSGCVRLEDAPRLARWLYGHPLTITKGMRPEQHVDLAAPVPVYLSYLTAVPSGGQVVTYDDIYGRDRARLYGRMAAL
jgi:L,D-transpeptidase YcbB